MWIGYFYYGTNCAVPVPGNSTQSLRTARLRSSRIPLAQLVGVYASLERQPGHRRARLLARLNQSSLAFGIKAAPTTAFIDVRDFKGKEIKFVRVMLRPQVE